MSIDYYHGICQRYHGRGVEIYTHDGEVYRGIIEDVTDSEVFLLPLENEGEFGGFGYGYRGYGPYGSGYGPYTRGYRIALGAIAGISLLSLFFW
ncbi:hypothetical protein [Pseudogracilibacillus sp. SO30301A]|uniref:hypothetical protein n=1 Tax=Pseudogracilibacillus sp. SO30301A TaxID=3098291 RepID=UPI00300DD231